MEELHIIQVPDYRSPQIIGPQFVKMKAQPGHKLYLDCEVRANGEADQMLIYWLVNGQFPEDAPSSGRIEELEESTLKNGTVLRRRLLLKPVEMNDLESTFTCIVTNAAGSTRKITTLGWQKEVEKDTEYRRGLLTNGESFELLD